MTREEAIALFEKQLTAAQVVLDSGFGSNPGENDFLYRRRKEMAEIALSALRPVSREQVEKAWRGEWMALDECSNEGVYCKRCKKKVYRIEYANEKMRSPFCPVCGAAQTDEAVEMVMERLEALHGETKTD